MGGGGEYAQSRNVPLRAEQIRADLNRNLRDRRIALGAMRRFWRLHPGRHMRCLEQVRAGKAWFPHSPRSHGRLSYFFGANDQSSAWICGVGVGASNTCATNVPFWQCHR